MAPPPGRRCGKSRRTSPCVRPPVRVPPGTVPPQPSPAFPRRLPAGPPPRRHRPGSQCTGIGKSQRQDGTRRYARHTPPDAGCPPGMAENAFTRCSRWAPSGPGSDKVGLRRSPLCRPSPAFIDAHAPACEPIPLLDSTKLLRKPQSAGRPSTGEKKLRVYAASSTSSERTHPHTEKQSN